MADGDQPDESQKTEDPTPKRLEESRKKGQVAISREVNTWIMLLAITILISAAVGGVMKDLGLHLRAYLEHAHALPGAPGGMSIVLGQSFREVIGILGLPFLVLMFAAFIGPFIQAGPLFSPETIKPDLSKISPMKGLERLFSQRALLEFAKGILKLAIVGVVGFILLRPYYGQIEHMVGLPVAMILQEVHDLVVKLFTGVLVVLVIVAGVDLVYQRAEHHKKMRMTKQEIKDELRQSEGDPHARARMRQLRSDRARQRMMQAVPEADVIITNPTHYSIALKYDPEENDAPICVAKGVDAVALRIRETAQEHDVTLYENPPLARVLYDTLELGDIVPPEHYKAVAEIISYVFRLKGKLPQA